jgi:hypothetical protein
MVLKREGRVLSISAVKMEAAYAAAARKAVGICVGYTVREQTPCNAQRGEQFNRPTGITPARDSEDDSARWSIDAASLQQVSGPEARRLRTDYQKIARDLVCDG